jgi:hypothetical protein
MSALPPPPATVAPDADALFRLLAGRLSEDDRIAIARADHGQDADAHLAALRTFIRDGTLARLSWWPREVLELTRWDEPAHEAAAVERHWRRAFACAALLRAMSEPDNQDLDGQSQTLASLLDSLHALGRLPRSRAENAVVEKLDDAATAFLAWLTPRLVADEGTELPFYGLGLLWCALGTDASDADLVCLADWVMAAEAAVTRQRVSDGPSSHRWLLDTTPYDQRHHLWRAMGTRLPDRLAPRHGAGLSAAVRRIAALLVGGEGPASPPEGSAVP